MATPPDRDRPRLPSAVYRDIKAAAGTELDAVATAYAAAGDALAAGDRARALQLLQDAKRRAPRSAAVREALGIALYLDERFKDAARELGAYRRMSGRQDQNHLLADCARANGQLDRAEELVAEMTAAAAPADRVAEGLLVVAGARADRGEHDAALAALHRMDLEPRNVEPHHLRLWYLAADISAQQGDTDAETGYLQAIATVEPDFLDVAERLDALEADADDQASAGSDSKRLRQ
jgi:tetratricopeptide (TPR) repeat protein